METGEPIAGIVGRLVAANVYLGARPIAEAIRRRGSDRLHRPCRRRLADAGPRGGPFRLGLGRLGPAGRRLDGRASDRVRRPGDGRPLARLAGDPRPRRGRLSDRRGRRRRLVRDHQARGDRRAGQRRDRRRATPLRDRRPVAVPDARRRRRFHAAVDRRAGGRSRRGDRGGRESAVGPPQAGRRSIATAGRPAACSRSWAATPRPRRAAAGAIILDRVRRAGYTLADSLVECFGAGDVAPGVVLPKARRSRWSCESPSGTPIAPRSSGSAASSPRWSRPARPASPATRPDGRRRGRHSVTGRRWCPDRWRKTGSPSRSGPPANGPGRPRLDPIRRSVLVERRGNPDND